MFHNDRSYELEPMPEALPRQFIEALCAVLKKAEPISADCILFEGSIDFELSDLQLPGCLCRLEKPILGNCQNRYTLRFERKRGE